MLAGLVFAVTILALFAVPAAAVAWALSSPLQRYADRLRPPPDAPDPLVDVTIAALLPAGVFGAASAVALLLLLLYPPQPNIMMNGWMLPLMLLFGILLGMVGNVLVSAMRTHRWILARRTAVANAQRNISPRRPR